MNKVLYVSTEGQVSGAENSLLLLLPLLGPKYNISVACPRESVLGMVLEGMGVHCHYLRPRRSASYLSVAGIWDWLVLNLQVAVICHNTHPTIIHANNIYAALTCLLCTFLTRVKLIWHSRDFIRFSIVAKFCSWRSNHIIAVSECIRESLIEAGVSDSNIDVVYNGVTAAADDSSERVEVLKNDSSRATEHPIVFANVGQFIPWKKQTLFLEAASIVAAEKPPVEFWLVGEDVHKRNGAYVDVINKAIANCALSGITKLTGWQSDMQSIWKNIDCLVHTADREPFGRVIIEAMAAGVPIIAVNAGGPGEILTDQETAILVPPNNAEALSKAMIQIAGDAKLRDRLSAAARCRVISQFTSERTASQIEAVYEDVLSGQ